MNEQALDTEIRTTRRVALKAAVAQIAMLALPVSSSFAAVGGALFAYVGCRTTKERNARGKGISVYRVDSNTGDWKLVQLVEGLDNPSFLAFDRTQKYLYAVHGDLGDVSAYAVDVATGQLALINRQSTGGKNPVHLVADPSNRFLIIANYATGSLVTLPILGDSGLGKVVDLVQLPGEPGPHKTQQGSSHPHQVAFDRSEKFIIVPDKGLDKVFVYQINAETGKLSPSAGSPVTAREGAGSRHVDFAPQKPMAYVMNELDSSITAYRYDQEKGALAPIQVVPTLPTNFTGNSTGAEIAVSKSGRFVYGSNRGHDSIVTMKVDVDSGLLSPVAWTSSKGKGPRFFALDPMGSNLYAANESSDTIVGFKVDSDSGQLTPNQHIVETGSPVCIVFRQMVTS